MSAIAQPDLPRPNEKEIRRQLDHLLASSVFRGSKRCQDFTNYVCNRALEGAAETLKERTIAIEVFGRRRHEEVGGDNIVRVGAREVRRRLALYYSGEGVDDSIRIDLPTGSYVPVFHYRAEASPSTGFQVRAHRNGWKSVSSAANPVLPAKPWRRAVFVLALLPLVAAASGFAWWRSSRHPTTRFEAFWKPVADFPTAPLLVMSHPIVYQPSSRVLLKDEEQNGRPSLPIQRPIHLPPRSIDGSDFVPVFNQYVGLGDAIAALRLYSLFSHGSRSARLQLADRVEFSDLYGSSAILIGGSFTNRWTAEMTKNMRYKFAFEGQSKPWIVDSETGQQWGLSSITDDRRTSEDYMLICRIPHAQTGAFMLIIAGLTVYGTEAAGRIVSDAKLLEPLLGSLPTDWSRHNLEMVMKVEVVSDGPTLPSLAAAYQW
ncbi:MAG: hypothetical protein JO356_11815 [Acidobacteria bacterium]|nr:hypothetical protein [Acidobacteriota bacterium]